MSFTVRVTKSVTEGSTSVSSSTDYACDTVSKISETVVDGTADAEFLVSVDISKLQAFTMMGTVDMTVKTNSAGSPQETFNLVANKPTVFETGDGALFAGDVTALYLSNASGADGTFRMVAGATS